MFQAANAEPSFDKVRGDQFSPKFDMLIEHYIDSEGNDQIWLVSTADPAKRHLLFKHQRAVEILFSPDQKWLVINNHSLSNETRLLLYRQQAFLDYKQVADLTEGACKFFDQDQRRVKPTNFGHVYVEALSWADDNPPTLLLKLDGHDGSRNNTSNWYCLYDVEKKTFTGDFAAHNKKMTNLSPE